MVEVVVIVAIAPPFLLFITSCKLPSPAAPSVTSLLIKPDSPYDIAEEDVFVTPVVTVDVYDCSVIPSEANKLDPEASVTYAPSAEVNEIIPFEITPCIP